MRSALLFAAALVATAPAFAAQGEVPLDLDAVVEAPKPEARGSGHGGGSALPFRLMGRIDLAYELQPYKGFASHRRDGAFVNNHFFLFLKLHAGKKVSFLGEVLDRKFYSINYAATERVTLQLGRILVPFGENTRFHHYYGGIVGIGTGVMFPNVWAELGVNAQTDLGPATLDTYVVNGIASTSATKDPSFTGPADPKTQALGARLTGSPVRGLKLIGSGYYDHWQPSQPLTIVGGDAVLGYGLVPFTGFRNVRAQAGFANAWVQGSAAGDYRRYSDYVEVATNALGFMEPRVRYGTLMADSRTRGTASDTQTLSLGANVPIDALNLLVEYQLNYEGADEKDNDLVRLMVSLDF